MTIRTKLTPSEAANASQGLQFLDSLMVFIPLEATFATTTVIAQKVIREPSAVIEIVMTAVDAGDGGANSDTLMEVKKNGTTILSTPMVLPDEATDGTIVVAFPASDALAKLEPNDILTIVTGADIGDVMVGCSVEVRIAKRWDDAVEKALLMPNI